MMYFIRPLAILLAWVPCFSTFSSQTALLTQTRNIVYNNNLIKAIVDPKQPVNDICRQLVGASNEQLSILSPLTVKTVVTSLISRGEINALKVLLPRLYEAKILTPTTLFIAIHTLQTKEPDRNTLFAQKFLLELADKCKYPLDIDQVHGLFERLIEYNEMSVALEFAQKFEDTLKLASKKARKNIFQIVSRLPNNYQLVNMMRVLSLHNNNALWSISEDTYVKGIKTAIFAGKFDEALDIIENLSQIQSLHEDISPFLLANYLLHFTSNSTANEEIPNNAVEARMRKYLDTQIIGILKNLQELQQSPHASLIARYLLNLKDSHLLVYYLNRVRNTQCQLSTLALLELKKFAEECSSQIKTSFGHGISMSNQKIANNKSNKRTTTPLTNSKNNAIDVMERRQTPILLIAHLHQYLRLMDSYVYGSISQFSLFRESLLQREYESNMLLVDQLVREVDYLQSYHDHKLVSQQQTDSSAYEKRNTILLISKELKRAGNDDLTVSMTSLNQLIPYELDGGLMLLLEQSVQRNDFNRSIPLFKLIIRSERNRSENDMKMLRNLLLRSLERNSQRWREHHYPTLLQYIYLLVKDLLQTSISKRNQSSSLMRSNSEDDDPYTFVSRALTYLHSPTDSKSNYSIDADLLTSSYHLLVYKALLHQSLSNSNQVVKVKNMTHILDVNISHLPTHYHESLQYLPSEILLKNHSDITESYFPSITKIYQYLDILILGMNQSFTTENEEVQFEYINEVLRRQESLLSFEKDFSAQEIMNILQISYQFYSMKLPALHAYYTKTGQDDLFFQRLHQLLTTSEQVFPLVQSHESVGDILSLFYFKRLWYLCQEHILPKWKQRKMILDPFDTVNYAQTVNTLNIAFKSLITAESMNSSDSKKLSKTESRLMITSSKEELQQFHACAQDLTSILREVRGSAVQTSSSQVTTRKPMLINAIEKTASSLEILLKVLDLNIELGKALYTSAEHQGGEFTTFPLLQDSRKSLHQVLTLVRGNSIFVGNSPNSFFAIATNKPSKPVHKISKSNKNRKQSKASKVTKNINVDVHAENTLKKIEETKFIQSLRELLLFQQEEYFSLLKRCFKIARSDSE